MISLFVGLKLWKCLTFFCLTTKITQYTYTLRSARALRAMKAVSPKKSAILAFFQHNFVCSFWPSFNFWTLPCCLGYQIPTVLVRNLMRFGEKKSSGKTNSYKKKKEKKGKQKDLVFDSNSGKNSNLFAYYPCLWAPIFQQSLTLSWGLKWCESWFLKPFCWYCDLAIATQNSIVCFFDTDLCRSFPGSYTAA